MVGASRTSPVPGNGMRRRHARRRILPSFGALRGDNAPTAALRGLRMITMVKCLHGCSSSCVWWQERAGLALSLYLVRYRTSGIQPFAWVPWGVYIGLPPRGIKVIQLGAGPAVSASDLRLLRRLLVPTGLVRSRQAASAVGGSRRLLITVAVLLMTRA